MFWGDDSSAERVKRVKISTYRRIGNHTNPIICQFVWFTIHILWNLYDYKFKTILYFFPKNLMPKSTWLVQLTWLSEFEFTNKKACFSWFWDLFVIKQWSRVENSSPNTSTVRLRGRADTIDAFRIWVYWALAKNERKFIKIARFSWFWALFVTKQRSRVAVSRPITSRVGSNDWYNWLCCQNSSLLSIV